MRRAELLERLPWVFQHAAETPDGTENPLSTLLGVMETIHEPDEQILASIDAYVDPRRAPDEFVPYLSWWVDMAWLFLDPPDDPHAIPGPPFPGGVGRLRELIATAARESKWRGTSAGLVRLLELATGIQGFAVNEAVVDESGAAQPFRIQVQAPSAAEPFVELIRRIAEHEKPAHVIVEPAVLFEQRS
jgi:phage tail-like protein